ncbi:prolipoprotein diacylglyceryl transferase [Niveispirillum sp. KHB5.9]|uniref:prolipoprotein diacylglyceryl transferase n=1 Tax=Niveispirillum sp. KHB5.9 TaxID=3400269 RepID=UPI003A85BF7C
MIFAIPFPDLDPVALALGPISIKWYGLAYAAGIAFALWYCSRLARSSGLRPTVDDLGDFVVWAAGGILIGGRLFSILFYDLGRYIDDPLEVFRVWHGGMSFHGGLTGVIVAIIIFSLRRGFSPFALGDLVACAAPVGLLLGRLANFVNAELWGRPSDVPWAMIFPTDNAQIPRHPSQLYQAGLEGVLLFIAIFLLARNPAIRARTGTLSGIFLIGYALARLVGEFFRQPDAQLGFLAFGTTMGQLLSIPMLIAGVVIVLRSPWGKPVPAPAETPK